MVITITKMTTMVANNNDGDNDGDDSESAYHDGDYDADYNDGSYDGDDLGAQRSPYRFSVCSGHPTAFLFAAVTQPLGEVRIVSEVHLCASTSDEAGFAAKCYYKILIVRDCSLPMEKRTG